MRKLILLIPFFAASCSTVEPTGGAPMPLINSAGQTIGTVRAWQTDGSVTFHISATGLSHGLHGLHIHSVGRCDPPGFTTAGPHWDLHGHQHGMNNLAGPHDGDLPNVEVEANGVLEATVTSPVTTMAMLLDADGSALVLHAQEDDYETDPSGNSGARIACAVIRPGAEVR
jgi:superoxide dismutase, Cu-Zn family